MVSTGVRNLVKLMAGWGLGCALVAFTLVHFEDVRTTLGLKLAPEDFGIVAGSPSATPETGGGDEAADGEREAGSGDEGRDDSRGGAQPTSTFSRSVLITRGNDGHFHADAAVNGRTLPVLIDTGATSVVLTYEDAKSAGIAVNPGDFRYISNTANGQARFARVTLNDVRIGDVAVRNVDAAVGQPGRLTTSLLGMSFLGQLRMEMKGRTLVLEQ